MKNILGFIFVMYAFLFAVRIDFAEESGQDLLANALNQMKELHVQTGDLFLWATNEMDSVLIQRFTEGPYSHAGVLSVDSEGKILLYDVYPGQGLRKSPVEEHFGKDRDSLVAVAVIRYKGTLNQDEISGRLDQFWARKEQIGFDQSMALEPDSDYVALLSGKKLHLYCTEFTFRLYEGVMSGPAFSDNDYARVYMQKDIFQSIPWDEEIQMQFARWVGVQPGEQFQKWLTNHKSQTLISANGMLRAGGFDVLYEKKDKSRFKPWALRLLEVSPVNAGAQDDIEKS